MNNHKLLFSIIVLTGIFNSILAQVNIRTLEKDWILVKATYNSNNDIADYFSGFLYSYKGDTSMVRNVYESVDHRNKFQLRDSSIIYKDTIAFKIVHLSSDSLKIASPDNWENTYVPVNHKSKINRLTHKYFTENNWVYATDSIQGRIDFQSKAFENSESDIVKQCVSHFKSGIYNYQNIEKWSLINFNENTFINLTSYKYWVSIHQILSIKNDSIRMCTWGGDKFIYPVLIRQKKLESETRKNIINHLTSKRWYTIKVFDYSTELYNFRKDSLDDIKTSGVWGRDTVFMKKKDFLKKKISYKFYNNMEFVIFIKNEVFTSGRWDLSFDGKYIVLNDGNTTCDYIELIDLGNDSLQIGKHDMFNVGKRNVYVEYYYYMIMK